MRTFYSLALEAYKGRKINYVKYQSKGKNVNDKNQEQK